MPSFADQAKSAFPAEIHMISCHFSNLDANFETVGPFELPVATHSGICTRAMISALWRDQLTTAPKNMSWIDFLKKMRTYMEEAGARNCLPELSSSRKIQLNKPFEFVPNKMGEKATKRAILIGINYIGQVNALENSHLNVENMKNYLVKVQGFRESDIVILMDDKRQQEPTRKNIIAALLGICKLSHAGDTAFIHYSGHGGRWKDNDEDPKSGYEETIIPSDFSSAGHIHGDELYKFLLCAVPAGVHTTVVMDTCHSVVKLPYKLVAPLEEDDPNTLTMTEQAGYAFGEIATLMAGAAVIGGVVGVASALDGESGTDVCCGCCVDAFSDFFVG